MDTINRAVRDALAKRDDRRDALATRILDIVEPALDAARKRALDLGEIRLEYRRPAGDCSQWSNRMDYPGHKGDPELMLLVGDDVRSFGTPTDVGFHDGRNWQIQKGPTRDAKTGQRLRPATVAQLRAVAAALPAALTALLVEVREEAEAEAKAAEEAAARLAS